MKHWILTLLTCSTVWAANFAGFTIKAYGDQDLDLSTGVTTLPKGGMVNDSQTGLTVDAQWIRFKDNGFLEAKEARIKLETTGTLSASSLRYDMVSQKFTAEGNLRYSDGLIKDLKAKDLELDGKNQVLVIRKGISSTEPKLVADKMLVDYTARVAIMQGNYTFQYKGTKLNGKGDKATLWIGWNEKNEFKTNTKPNPEQLKRYTGLFN